MVLYFGKAATLVTMNVEYNCLNPSENITWKFMFNSLYNREGRELK
jgi:hypothetical protein